MYSEELLKLNQEKSKVLEKVNFLLEGLQDVNDKEEKDTTLELINKLKIRLASINKQIESLSPYDTSENIDSRDNQSVEEQETKEQDNYIEGATSEESYDDKIDATDMYEDTDDESQEGDEIKESNEEDEESPKVYVGRKDNGNILAYYQRLKKQGK